ncbi:MAG TPA: hypothetical protein VF453_07695 [Burkholderiaceae bacterium]
MNAHPPHDYRVPSNAELLAAAGAFEDRVLAAHLDAEDSAYARRQALLDEINDVDRAAVFVALCQEGKVAVDEDRIDELLFEEVASRLNAEARAISLARNVHPMRDQRRADRLVELLLAAEELVAAADASMDRGDLLQGAKSKLFGAWARCGGALVTQAHREAA